MFALILNRVSKGMKRQLFVFSDFTTEAVDIDDELLKKVGEGYKDIDVETTFVIVPSDEAETSKVLEENKYKLKTIVDLCGGKIVPLGEFVSQTKAPHVKSMRQTSSCRGLLTIGDKDVLGEAMNMQVWVHAANMEKKFPSLGKVVANTSGIDENLHGHKTERQVMYTYKEPKDEIEEGQVNMPAIFLRKRCCYSLSVLFIRPLLKTKGSSPPHTTMGDSSCLWVLSIKLLARCHFHFVRHSGN